MKLQKDTGFVVESVSVFRYSTIAEMAICKKDCEFDLVVTRSSEVWNGEKFMLHLNNRRKSLGRDKIESHNLRDSSSESYDYGILEKRLEYLLQPAESSQANAARSL